MRASHGSPMVLASALSDNNISTYCFKDTSSDFWSLCVQSESDWARVLQGSSPDVLDCLCMVLKYVSFIEKCSNIVLTDTLNERQIVHMAKPLFLILLCIEGVAC